MSIAALGCGASAPPPERPQVVTLPKPAPAPPPAKTAEPAAPVEHSRATAPHGYVEMVVVDMISTRNGAAVLLGQSESSQVVVPVFIGGTEALSIELRRRHDSYPRPLTHDLLESLVRALGGELVKVQVDELRNDVFIGSVYVRRGEAILQVDARPSDAIALALGSAAPIFVAQAVVDRAGQKRDEPADASSAAAPPSGAPPPPATIKRPLKK
jgi:bifunctional DNase/RNase